MVKEQYKITEPINYPQEVYYADVPITIKLAQISTRIERSNLTSFIIGAIIPMIALLVGYRMGYIMGRLEPWYDLRGWIALLFIAIGLPIVTIYYHNKQEMSQ